MNNRPKPSIRNGLRKKLAEVRRDWCGGGSRASPGGTGQWLAKVEGEEALAF